MQETHFGPIWFIPGENDGKYPFCHSLYIESAGILIDPASDRKRLKELKKDPGVKEVWLSHWHEDHFMHLDLFDDLPLRIMKEDAAPLTDLELFTLQIIAHQFANILFVFNNQYFLRSHEVLSTVNQSSSSSA